jgi:chromosome segregation ATPase
VSNTTSGFAITHHELNFFLQSELKAEVDRLSREKKDLSERLREAESQLDWVRSEHDDEVAKLVAEKKGYQDRLRDAEAQLSQLKSRKRDELKVFLSLDPCVFFCERS